MESCMKVSLTKCPCPPIIDVGVGIISADNLHYNGQLFLPTIHERIPQGKLPFKSLGQAINTRTMVTDLHQEALSVNFATVKSSTKPDSRIYSNFSCLNLTNIVKDASSNAVVGKVFFTEKRKLSRFGALSQTLHFSQRIFFKSSINVYRHRKGPNRRNNFTESWTRRNSTSILPLTVGGKASDKWQKYAKTILRQDLVKRIREQELTRKLIKVLCETPQRRNLRSDFNTENAKDDKLVTQKTNKAENSTKSWQPFLFSASLARLYDVGDQRQQFFKEL